MLARSCLRPTTSTALLKTAVRNSTRVSWLEADLSLSCFSHIEFSSIGELRLEIGYREADCKFSECLIYSELPHPLPQLQMPHPRGT